MLQRHRVPTIFSIYMLDVICCALGCVVLLWQVAHQEAIDQTKKVASAEQQLKDAAKTRELAKELRDKLKTSQQAHTSATDQVGRLERLLASLSMQEKKTAQSLADAEKEREAARKLATARQDEIDQAKKTLTLSEEQLKKINDDLAKLLAAYKKTEKELTNKVTVNVELLAKLALAEKQITSLEKDIDAKKLDVETSSKKLQNQLVQLKLSEENALRLQKLLDGLREQNKDASARLAMAEKQLQSRDLELEKHRAEMKDLLAARDKLGKEASKELTEAKGRITALISERDQWKEKSLMAAKELVVERDLWKQQSLASTKELNLLKEEKNKLSQRLATVQAEVDQRFAGIPLTGESVIFLIDASGSMVMKDAKTADPDKWPFLCETLMQLMRSLTSMKRFQVIVFSDKVEYLFGNKDYWMKYDGPQTALATRDKLRKHQVGGNTNMHDGFDEAFRYRKQGLDTIYFFSDGLPNVGEGLPPEIRTPSEAELSFHLGKHVRDKLRNDWNRPIKGREQVRINAIGFFFESPDVGAFLWALAREHRGNFVGVR